MESATDQKDTTVVFDQTYLLTDQQPRLTCEVTAWRHDKSLTIMSDIDGDFNAIFISHNNVIKLKNFLNQLY